MTGKRYGRLTALYALPPHPTLRRQWVFRCECGVEKAIDGYHVRKGRIVSCGCYLAEVISTPEAKARIAALAGTSTRTHGKSKTPVYAVWKTMRQRCNNPGNKDYLHYGGRGIFIALEWDNFEVFEKDMGPRPKGFTLERVNNEGGYTPDNCVWADWTTQQNNRRSNH